jgi:hypothetical protein
LVSRSVLKVPPLAGALQMNAKQFVQAVRVAVHKSAAKGTIDALLKPPGRRPNPELVMRSEWFNRLKPVDRDFVARIADMAAEQATYNFLLALDGAIALEPAGPKGTFELSFDDGERRVLLNDGQLSFLFKEQQ